MRLGFDVGGTKTDAVVVAPGEEILARLLSLLGSARAPAGYAHGACFGVVRDFLDRVQVV